MGVRCSICAHPERARIEALRLSGASLDSIVAKFELRNRDALWRHMNRHVTAAHRAALIADIPLSELAERVATESSSLLDHLKIVRSNLMTMFLTAAGEGDNRAAAALSGRLLEALRDQGALTGELMRNSGVTNIGTVNVFNSTIIVNLQAMLVERLRGHPEALARVIEGLRDLEARQGTGGELQGLGHAA